MAVSGLDHVAIPTEKTEELIAFYKRLGFAVVDEERWRAGQAPLSVVHPKRGRASMFWRGVVAHACLPSFANPVTGMRTGAEVRTHRLSPDQHAGRSEARAYIYCFPGRFR